MKLPQMQSAESVLADSLKDPEFRAHWEATTLARLVANRLVAYRAEHGLSQTALAQRLDMKQPAIARLERGERNPSLETLARVSAALGIEIAIAFSTSNSRKLSGSLERAAKVKGKGSVKGSTMLVAAS